MNPGGRTVQQNGIRQGQIGGISVAGGRTNNTMFLLDGAMNTDLDYSTLNYSPSIDGIAEFQVQTAMVGAEYARVDGQRCDQVRRQRISRQRFRVPAESKLRRASI